jgi:rubrerythrin
LAVAGNTSGTDMAVTLRAIENAIGDEAEDRLIYEYMVKMTPVQEEKDIIKGISADEFTHHNMFRQMYYDLTGRMPQVKETTEFTRPKSYCEGLKKGIDAEQDAIRKYKRILAAMTERKHYNTMTDIIADEVRHGILFNYLYAKNGCKE